MDRTVHRVSRGTNEDALQCARGAFLYPLCTTLFLFFGIMIFSLSFDVLLAPCVFSIAVQNLTVQHSNMIRGLVSNGNLLLGHRRKIGRWVTYLLRVHIIFSLF